MNKIIPYAKQWIDEDDLEAVSKVLRGDYLTTGPTVLEFEKSFANYVGSKYAVAVANGTAGLHLACLAAGLGSGDEVITSPMTFAASANCCLYVDAVPVFADIDPITNNINPLEIEKKITKHTKAIIPVHYTGLPCDMEAIYKIAQKHNLIVIEDACHALGAQLKGTRIGDCRFSNMTVFSFHPVKHITTGEGGMITTNSLDIYKKLIMLRSHGINRDVNEYADFHGDWYHEMQILGYNYRLTDLQCALGQSQLNKINWIIERRRFIADLYHKELKELNLQLPIEPEGYVNSYHLYVIKVADPTGAARKSLFYYLKEHQINCQVHYIPVHTHPYYRKQLNYNWNDYPNAENHYWRALSLPLYPSLSDHELEYVIDTIKRFKP